MLDYLLELKAEGRIRNLGFSFHGDMALFEWLLSQPVEWDFVQIQMNWLDWRDRKLQAERLYTMLAERKIPVIVMEPIRGWRAYRPSGECAGRCSRRPTRRLRRRHGP